MGRRLDEIALPFESIPLPPPLREVATEAVALRDSVYAFERDDRIPAFCGTDPSIAWSLLTLVRTRIRPCGDSFCEWGSGLGIVTCLAEALGWRACGLEIEPRLVEAATTFARRHGYQAEFFEGSYRTDPDDGTPVGVDPFGADVIFAYTWPSEIKSMIESIERYAEPDTLFIQYRGGIQASVFRVGDGTA